VRASGIESEHFVGEVESGSDQLQATVHTETSLRIPLGVSIKISISFGSFDAEVVTVLKAVAEDVGVIVRNPNPNRNTPMIVRWTDVPCIGGLPGKCRLVGTGST
jgi:hypothetical protein